MASTEWTKLINCGSGLEADMIAARLESAGLRAQVRGNDIVGIFGPGFQGVTARGVDVLVPESELDAARAELEQIQAGAEPGAPDESDQSDDDAP